MPVGYADSALESRFMVMLNRLPQLKMEQANTISTISSSLNVSLSVPASRPNTG